ncbi:MAG TPA: Nramp family divalent metal transporter [Candidatus Elarobacter sp.]|nr:Nramp family divalent metal transporter [Candidatus Elarobacter sp.]
MNVQLQRLPFRAFAPIVSRVSPPPALARAKWWTLLGPAFAVSIGYIDPGNWATDLAAGTFGFRLLWVIILANLIAMALQVAVVRLAVLTGEDLASAIARQWPRVKSMLWLVFQGSAIATDLAEFTGITLGIQMLLHWSMLASVASGLTIVGLILFFGGRRSKVLESMLLFTIGAVALVFAYQVYVLHPSGAAVAAGTIPRIPNISALLVVVAIIGATVMPHNLFLHSSLVLKNCESCDEAQRADRARFFFKETFIALNVAALINGGILVVGASLHGANESIQIAFQALVGLAGGTGAIMFGAALLLTGIAASTTATLSGDYVFRAFSPWKISPLVRRALTLAPSGALLLAGVSATSLLVWSQVALALMLPVVIVPLILELRRAYRLRGLPLARPIYLGAVFAAIPCVAFDAVLIAQPILWPS